MGLPLTTRQAERACPQSLRDIEGDLPRWPRAARQAARLSRPRGCARKDRRGRQTGGWFGCSNSIRQIVGEAGTWRPQERHFAAARVRYRIVPMQAGLHSGEFMAPLRLQIRPGKYREPDVLLVLSASDRRRPDPFWTGADLAVEVVSPDK